MSAVKAKVESHQQNTAQVNGRPSLSSERGSEKLEFIEGDLASHERFMMLASALAPGCQANCCSSVSIHAGWLLPVNTNTLQCLLVFAELAGPQ